MKWIEIDWLKRVITVERNNGTYRHYYHLTKSRFVWLSSLGLKTSDLGDIKTFFWVKSFSFWKD